MATDSKSTLAGQVANPNALGFGILAVVGWMYSMPIAGWYPVEITNSATGIDVAILAAYALLVAGLASFLRGETWHAVFFMFWSAYAWTVQAQLGEAGAEAYRGWFYLTLSVFLFLLAWGAVQEEAFGLLRPAIALGSGLTLLGVSLGYLGAGALFFLIGGYTGLVTAVLEFWLAAEEIGATAKVPATRSEEPSVAT